jgi:pre-mRNA-processing factor 6
VIRRCLLAEPRYGPVWQSIAKDVENAEKSTEEVLELVSEALH